MTWEFIAKITGVKNDGGLIANTSTYGQAYTVEWYRTQESMQEALLKKRHEEHK
jgi:hypothetical protein